MAWNVLLPVGNACLVQLRTLLEDVGRVIALVNALERPVVAALRAHRDLVEAQIAQGPQLLHRLVAQVGDAASGVDVLDVGQVLANLLQDGRHLVVGKDQRYAQAHRLLWERRDFYRRAFEEDVQNSIERYLLQFSVEANEAALRRYLGVAKLARAYAFEAHHFAHGNVGCVIDWLRGNLQATPEQLASSMFACMPKQLHDAYDALASQES